MGSGWYTWPMPKEKEQPATKKDIESVIGSLKDFVLAAFSTLDKKMDTGFQKVHRDIKKIQGDVVGIKKDIVGMKGDIMKLKENIVVIKKDIVDMKGDIIGIKFDIHDIKQDQKEMKQEIHLLRDSVGENDTKIRFQKDFPERLVQAENDIYKIKLKVFHVKDGKA